MDDEEQKLNIDDGEDQEPDTLENEEEPDTDEDEQAPKRHIFHKVLPYIGAIAFFASIPLSVYYKNGLFSVFAALFFTVCFIPYIVVFFRELKDALRDNSEIPRTPEREQELIDEVNSAQNRTESRIALAKYHGREADSVSELVASSFGFDKKSREALKTASTKDKLKVIAIFGAFGLCLLVMMAGVAFANAGVGYIGFPLMGAGGGGFFLVIIVLIVIQSLKKRGYFNDRAYSEFDRRDNEIVVSGKVFRCVPYCVKQVGDLKRATRIPRISVDMYQIVVVPEGTNNYVNFVCSKYYTEGDTVKFLQDVKRPQKMRLIEEEYYPADYMPGVDDKKEQLLKLKKLLEDKNANGGDTKNDE